MLRTPAWAHTWTALRAAVAVLITVAIVAQASATIGGAIEKGRDAGTTVTNFFSFFTILSNVLSVVVLAWAVIWFWSRGRADASPEPEAPQESARRALSMPEPRALAIALASVTTYMLITGIVYNTLLRGIQLPQGTTVPWSNEVLHVVAPLFLLADLFVGPRRRCLGWGVIGAVLGFPLVWVIYTMVRGPLVTNPVTGAPYWYPYPFLDPNSATTGGYWGVIAYIVGIAVGIAVVAAIVIAVGRSRGRTRTDASAPDPATATTQPRG